MRAGIASLLLVVCVLAISCAGRGEQHAPSPPEIKRQSAAGAVIPAGTIIVLRIVDPIAAREADDSLGYAAVTARDIAEQSGKILILAGSPAILGVAQNSSGLSLVLKSVMINGNNYPVAARAHLSAWWCKHWHPVWKVCSRTLLQMEPSRWKAHTSTCPGDRY